MRVTSIIGVTLGLCRSLVLAQDLPTALANYPETSTFQGLIGQVPGGVSGLLPSGLSPNSSNGVTLLIPSNSAFSTFSNGTNSVNITSLPLDQLLDILLYHIMYAKLTSANFSSPDGLIVPTLLNGQQYNNRSAGAELIKLYGADAAQGNVVYISQEPINPVKFRVRQQQNSGVALRGGMGQGATMNAVDGTWDFGYFQILDSVLAPPSLCSTTIKGQSSLDSLNTALTNAGLWDAIDHSANITCLGPSNSAFQAAGNPQLSLNSSALSSALLFHTLPMPLYSPYITSGMVMQSLAGLEVTVAKVGDDIYFNDAKVISPNVMTNNGLIHVLDKVMSPNGTAPAATATTVTPTPSPCATGAGMTTTESSCSAATTNAAVHAAGNTAVRGLVAFFAAAAVLI